MPKPRNAKATQCHRITYRSGQLIGYTDVDFGGFVVTDGAYSMSDYVFQLAGTPVSWPSKRQKKVATSTTHAEYIGQYNAFIHLQWLRTFLAEPQMYPSTFGQSVIAPPASDDILEDTVECVEHGVALTD
ncbi:hypothetical protein MYU51_006469 [Penicillium brevicompactum]